MLNVSPNNSVKPHIREDSFHSFGHTFKVDRLKLVTRSFLIIMLVGLVFLFLPWTQNIRTPGYVTTLEPEQRPQKLNSIIAGQIEQWYVREGDYVEKGDTILFIREVKDQYFDPELLERTERQIEAKELSVLSYQEKIAALNDQIAALRQVQGLKFQQAENKLQQARLKARSDSMDVTAAETQFAVAQAQYDRTDSLYGMGLKSLTDLENKRQKLQERVAKLISAQNKFLAAQNERINAQVELASIENQYRDKIRKAESEKFSAMSAQFDTEASVAKMQNEFTNYSMRLGMYYITAPQDGYIIKTAMNGIGEIIKEGDNILTLMPADYDIAVELYVQPVDLPLIKKGQNVQIVFDGWPAIAFSGWPNASHGTFAGEVVAIDRFISENGKYRILVAPDESEYDWPDALRVGAGAQGMALLKDVPLWYEIWRQLNAFPPKYYEGEGMRRDPKFKAPIKAVK